MDNLVTVNEAAKVIGVSPDTIRRWDKKGLIKAHRSDLNYRLFNSDEIQRTHNKLFNKSTKNNFKILKSKPTNHTVIELFSGAGGTALGFENAGLKDVMLVENDKNASATLKKNRPKWNVVAEDIKTVNFKGLKADIVEGGFPCQSFSYAGKKMGFEDARGTLFFEFARCIKEVRPKIAMGENVKGLENHDGGRTLASMVEILEDLGYRVAYKVLRSQYLDVPQKRERLIILAIRKDLDIPFLFPKEKDYTISMREALENCPPAPGQQYPAHKKAVMELIPPGGYWRNLPLEMQKAYMGASFFMEGGKTGMARRLSWDEPSLTLTCAPAQKQTERCHPEETRPLNVREYARIQTFPDKWQFEGSTSSIYKQIGNAVPANLGYHIGRCLIAMLDNKPDLKTMEVVMPSAKSSQGKLL
jgi:DNA (cytosine-5)-methyltransferase 1